MKHFYILIFLGFTGVLSAQTLQHWSFEGGADGWTGNVPANFSHNDTDGSIQLFHTGQYVKILSPDNLNMSTNDIKFISVKAKRDNLTNNKLQLVTEITNSSGSSYTVYQSPMETFSDSDDFETLVFRTNDYAGQTDNNGNNKWDDSTLDRILFFEKPNSSTGGTTENPTYDEGTLFIQDVKIIGEIYSEFEGHFLNVWKNKSNVPSILVNHNGISLETAVNKNAKIFIDSYVKIPKTHRHLYISLVNSTSDNQIRVINNSNSAFGEVASMTTGSTDVQTLYFLIDENYDTSDGMGGTIARSFFNGQYYDPVAITFRNTNNSNKSSGGDYLIKSIVFSQNVLSKEEIRKISGFKIYPNPAGNYFIAENAVINDKLEIFNVVGKLIKTQNIHSVNEKIDIEELNRGIYFVRVNDGRAVRLIKK